MTPRAWHDNGDEILPGDIMVVRGVRCRVTRVLPLGTVDVEAVDRSRAYRVTGLWMVGRPKED